MSSNVGLSTPRGSGTSGYVQRNSALLKTRDNNSGSGSYAQRDAVEDFKLRQRQPDAGIIEHERKREVEVRVFELRDRLEEEGVEEEEIDEQCEGLRKKLLASGGGEANAKVLKSHQVHELAKAKIEESERLRKALGIRKDYEEGGHWKRQDERAKGLKKERVIGREQARERSRSRSPRKERERSWSRSPRRDRSRSRSRSRD